MPRSRPTAVPLLRRTFVRKAATLATAAGLMAAGLAAPGIARAEEGRLRIAQQFGIVYLLLNVAQEQKLIEKHGKAAGVDIQVEFLKLSGGSAVNDALLSGSIDIAGVMPEPPVMKRTWSGTRSGSVNSPAAWDRCTIWPIGASSTRYFETNPSGLARIVTVNRSPGRESGLETVKHRVVRRAPLISTPSWTYCPARWPAQVLVG